MAAHQQQLGSISSGIETLSQVLSLLEAFRAFDSDNDGFITIAELGGILGSLGYANASKEDHVRAMMQEGDKDRDGLLSTQEFLEMNTKDLELGQLLANSLKTAFQALDHGDDDQDNVVVTAEELYEVMINGSGLGNNLCLEDCQDIVASMDADGDGAISFEDFKIIVNSLP